MIKNFYSTLVLTALFLLVYSPAHAGTYTYSRSFDSSVLNKYSYELKVLDTSQSPACYAISERVYPTAADCTATENNQLPAGASVLDNCTQITKLNYDYTLDTPVCGASVSALSFAPTSPNTVTNGTYTYSRNLDASAVNQYSYEVAVVNTSANPQCVDITGQVFSDQGSCAAQRDSIGQLPAGAVVLDDCVLLTKQTYDYTLNYPACSSTVSGAGLTQTGSPTTNTSGSGILRNPLQAPDLATLLSEILGYVVKIGSIFLVLMLVFVGFQFVMAQGNPEKVQSARSSLLWTAVGGLLLLGAQAIAMVIASTVQGL